MSNKQQIVLYRTNLVARQFLPKQSPALRDISTQKGIAKVPRSGTPPKSKSGGRNDVNL
jgi:hypothetical protein